MTLRLTILCHYGECHILLFVRLNVIMLSVIKLNVIMQSDTGSSSVYFRDGSINLNVLFVCNSIFGC